jgi:vitamin B12 transporter
MPTPHHRTAALYLLTFLTTCLTVLPAAAVVVSGTVTDPLGKPIPNARVQLVQGQHVVAFAFTDYDGSYIIRSVDSGRFLLLTAVTPYSPSIGTDFYGGSTAVVTRNIVLEYTLITQQLTSTSSGIPTPVQQIPAPIVLIPQAALATQIGISNDLRQYPGVQVIQTGQAGSPIALNVRGGSDDANKVLIDGVPATDIGGRFNLSPISTTTLAGPELYRGANSAFSGTGAEASTLALATTRGNELRPALNYTGDAGNFHTYRNEAVVSGAFKPLDYLAAFSRFNTSNTLPLDQYHLTTSTANIGYSILTNTLARFTLRDTVAATGLPGPYDIYGISASGKQSDEDIYSGFAIENTWAGNWHNLARYGIARQREQVEQFTPTGIPVTTIIDGTPQTTYYGDTVTIRGANGYNATGQAAFILPTYDTVSNRDEFLYQTDYTFPYRIAALFSFHYENERGRLTTPVPFANGEAQRTNFLYTLQIQGDIKYRLFYSLGGAIERNHLFGTAGTPRLGLSYVPVSPGPKPFRGTSLRANVATGVQEPSLFAQLTSLDTLLNETGNTEAIAAYNVAPLTAERSRTYDFGIDQNILEQKLILKAGYFHNEFNHQIEQVDANGLEQYFNIPASVAVHLPPASLNSLAYRTQGLETELQYQPFVHLIIRGGYTYLASYVLQSFSSSAVAAADGTPTTNPDNPGIPIGALSPLVGNRLFLRAPSTGSFAAQYSGTRFSASIKGALVSRSDDSTYQLNNDRDGGNTLLLPNRNLAFGYTKMDLNLLYTATHHVTVFTQLDNLLSQHLMGPIGYQSLPFTFRAGMKIRIGGN